MGGPTGTFGPTRQNIAFDCFCADCARIAFEMFVFWDIYVLFIGIVGGFYAVTAARRLRKKWEEGRSVY
jgi:hypothetical protein